MTVPLTIALGPPAHGVTRFAVECAQAAGTPLLEVPDVAALPDALAALPPERAREPLHLHVTETLFGADPDEAAGTIEALAAERPLAVTLHDVPQPAEGAERCERRSRAYRRIAATADLVVVSSDHERRLCEEAGIAVDAVIPLPVPDLAVPGLPAPDLHAPELPAPYGRPAQPTRDVRSVGVFGFLHPGKAVDLVADAVAELAAAGDRAVTLRLLGAAAQGHEQYVRDVMETVRAAGGRAEVTGRIDDDELARVLGEVTVPVAVFRNVSASGSLNTWMAAGRRPLTTDSDYTRELEHRRPGSLLLTDGHDLPGVLRALLDDPAPTRGEAPEPGSAELGAAYLRLWNGWAA